MSEEDTLKIEAIVSNYRTRANDATVYLDIMEGRLNCIQAGLSATKTLSLLVPALLAISLVPLQLSKATLDIWQLILWVLTVILGLLVVISYSRDWDSKSIDYQVFIEMLRVQQLGFQRQAEMVHDNANNISYTHRLEAERHDLLLGRIAKYVTLKDFRDRAKKLGLAPKPTAA